MVKTPSDIPSLEAALAARPRDAALWRAHAQVSWSLGRVAEALASFEAALALDAGDASAQAGRGEALMAAGRFEEAVASFDAALAVDSRMAPAWRGRGLALRALGLFDAAVASFGEALAADPKDAAALYERAQVLGLQFRDFGSAAADLARAIEIDGAGPATPYALGDLVHARMQQADWEGIAALRARVTAGVRDGTHPATPFVFQALSSSPADLQACATNYARRHFPAGPRACAERVRAAGKIRVGYLSGEFHAHATAFLTAGLFEQCDKTRFEIFAFDNGVNDGGPMRRRLEAAFDHVIDIKALSDAPAAEKICEAGIDILVNLNGYFGQGRMGVFARRAAPVQVNYLGFPGTLGADYIDYVLADRVVIPEAEQPFFTERVVYLPGSYQANDDKRALAGAARRGDHGLPEDAVVLANFNQTYKITPEMFSAWMRILRAVDKTVLWLWGAAPATAVNLRRAAEAAGVDARRLVFAGDAAHETHLARLALVDVYLDTLPYNAHTGASDALWAGVPLVTCRGQVFAGRVGASLLGALEMPELVTESAADFEALAMALAGDGARRSTLRAKLAVNRTQAPLFDTKSFARHIEAAYTTMIEINRRGDAPRAFAVTNA